MGWYDVATVESVTEDRPLAVIVAGERIALFMVGGTLYATEEVCPHAWASLTDGYLEDGIVECPLHQAPFDVRTGKCLGPPASRDLETYPVRVEDGRIIVGVPD